MSDTVLLDSVPLSLITQLRQIDPERLTEIVRQSLSCEVLELGAWSVAPIAYASVGTETRGLFRFTGTAHTQKGLLPWSVVLKVFRALPDGSTDAPTSAHYWKREARIYQSEMLRNLKGGLAVPRHFGVEERADNSLWLWLEDIQETTGVPWPLERYKLAAYHLGHFNGIYQSGEASLTPNWLSRDMTRLWAEENAYTLDLIQRPGVWETPEIRRAFTTPVADRLLRLWSERETFFHALERLPQTLCHQDAGHRNLLARRSPEGQEQTILIDWELVGIGAIGEELGNLFAPVFINFEKIPLQARLLETYILDGYLTGLCEAGWRGDPQSARLGYIISAVFRWVFAAAGWPIAILVDTSGQAEQQTLRQWNRPLEEVRKQWAELTYYLLELADEARERIKATNA